VLLTRSMPAQIDGLVASTVGPDGWPQNVTLRDVCFKPFGTECAEQSVLQYWRMDRQLFIKEQVRWLWAGAAHLDAPTPVRSGELELKLCAWLGNARPTALFLSQKDESEVVTQSVLQRAGPRRQDDARVLLRALVHGVQVGISGARQAANTVRWVGVTGSTAQVGRECS
jgi:hypothetical protein